MKQNNTKLPIIPVYLDGYQNWQEKHQEVIAQNR